jgi:hypothetical protein
LACQQPKLLAAKERLVTLAAQSTANNAYVSSQITCLLEISLKPWLRSPVNNAWHIDSLDYSPARDQLKALTAQSAASDAWHVSSLNYSLLKSGLLPWLRSQRYAMPRCRQLRLPAS